LLNRKPGVKGLPDVVDYFSETIIFDSNWLQENYRPACEFAQQHDVPVYISEFGVVRWISGASDFLRDQTELFEQFGWNYPVYVWSGDEQYFDGFNLEYGPDPSSHSPLVPNALLDVFTDRWTQNVDFPGEIPVGQE